MCIKSSDKLKNGDWFSGSYDELLEIISSYSPKMSDIEYTNKVISQAVGIYYSEPNNTLIMADRSNCKTQYDFPDFKQLCENTFGV